MSSIWNIIFPTNLTDNDKSRISFYLRKKNIKSCFVYIKKQKLLNNKKVKGYIISKNIKIGASKFEFLNLKDKPFKSIVRYGILKYFILIWGVVFIGNIHKKMLESPPNCNISINIRSHEKS